VSPSPGSSSGAVAACAGAGTDRMYETPDGAGGVAAGGPVGAEGGAGVGALRGGLLGGRAVGGGSLGG
jgi:hypothetical protein